MVMSRKRRNLLSKKRKNGKRNTKRNTKTHKNIRKMRGGMNGIYVGGIVLKVGSNFAVVRGNNMTEENINIFNNTLQLQRGVVNYRVESINVDNDAMITVNPLDGDGDPINADGLMVDEEDLNPLPRINIRKTVLGNKDIFKLLNVNFELPRP